MSNIRKFKVAVVRTDYYEIEIDTSVVNEQWMEDFAGFMYDFDTVEEHAEHIAQWRARLNNRSIYGGFPEGYGNIALKGYIREGAEHPFPAINITKADEDNDIDIDIVELSKI